VWRNRRKDISMHEPKYTHLTLRDRRLITKFRKEKLNISEIARRIGKDKSTVSRELRRNGQKFPLVDFVVWEYLDQGWSFDDLCKYVKGQPRGAEQFGYEWNHSIAQQNADARARAAQTKRRRKRTETREWVIEKLHEDWSPKQIAGRSPIDGPERVSHEYVYALVHKEKKNGGLLHRLLRRFGRRKQRFGARDYPRKAPSNDRVSIDERPAIVASRSRIGDCEADLIIGYRQSGCILSVVDRKSRRLVLRRLNSKHMHKVRKQLEIAFRKQRIVLTLTVDNGREFYGHKQLTENVGVPVYFTHPYCSTERGSIENANGLVRYYLPKRTSFEELSQQDLDVIAERINNRPRACLGYLTPNEVHFKECSLLTQ